jgi:NADH dehydrogenase
MGKLGQISLAAANVRDEASVAAAIEGADHVVNLVGILYQRGKQRFAAVHADAAGRIARRARAAGVERLVHVSALGADPKSPALYAQSKAAGERAVLEAFPDATIMRPSIVFGPEDDFFNRFAMLARLLPALPLIGGGRTRFQPVYVGDVAEAVRRALDDPAAKGRVYELGGPRVYTFKELLEIVLAETGRRRLLVPVPFPIAELQGRLLELSPLAPLLTRDQVVMLKSDVVVSPGAHDLRALGVAPTALELIVPTYLRRYRRSARAA